MTYAQLIADALITNAMELTALGKAKNTLTSKAVVNTQLNTLARDIANRTEGNPTQPVRDVTDDIDSRSEQELHFYLEHHHWLAGERRRAIFWVVLGVVEVGAIVL